VISWFPTLAFKSNLYRYGVKQFSAALALQPLKLNTVRHRADEFHFNWKTYPNCRCKKCRRKRGSYVDSDESGDEEEGSTAPEHTGPSFGCEGVVGAEDTGRKALWIAKGDLYIQLQREPLGRRRLELAFLARRVGSEAEKAASGALRLAGAGAAWGQQKTNGPAPSRLSSGSASPRAARTEPVARA
jgi:hypothetical protein